MIAFGLFLIFCAFVLLIVMVYHYADSRDYYQREYKNALFDLNHYKAQAADYKQLVADYKQLANEAIAAVAPKRDEKGRYTK